MTLSARRELYILILHDKYIFVARQFQHDTELVFTYAPTLGIWKMTSLTKIDPRLLAIFLRKIKMTACVFVSNGVMSFGVILLYMYCILFYSTEH